MTLYQFNNLERNQQYEVLWDKGVVIADRITLEYKFLLYQIDGFYVELKYDGTRNKIISLRSFINVSQLEPYLWNIDLPKID